MGDGVVLERGKHNELLGNEHGPYSRLVAAQRLREAQEGIDVDDVTEQSSKVIEGPADVKKMALDGISPDRSSTHRSLTSEILEQRKVRGPEKREKEYSMFYLFKRMGRINKDEWKSYLFGCLFAIGQYAFLMVQSGFAHCLFAAAGSVFPLLGIVWGAFNDIAVLYP